jgi:uncharacterized MAPEG superfamily protein
MKKNLIALFSLLMIGMHLFGQQSTANRDMYRQKSQDQRTAGWILTGLGGAMMIGGSIAFANNFEVFGPGGEAEAVVIALGAGITTAGIILLAKSQKNKSRADAFIYPKIIIGQKSPMFTMNSSVGVEGKLCIALQKQKQKYRRPY